MTQTSIHLAGPMGAAPSRDDALRLLTMVDAPAGLLATRMPYGEDLAPLPHEPAWAATGIARGDLEAVLASCWDRAVRDRRFTVDLPARTKALPFWGRLPAVRQLLVLRLDADRSPSQLLLLPLPATQRPVSGRQPLDALHLSAALDAAQQLERSATAPLEFRSWESFADALHHGLFLCDAGLTVMYINESAAQGLGLDPISVTGRSFLALPWDSATRAVLSGLLEQPGPFLRHARLERQSGPAIPVLLSGRLQHTGGLLIECYLHDTIAMPGSPASGYISFSGKEPPPLEAPGAMPIWSGNLALLPVTPSSTSTAIQEWIPLGAGVGLWLQLGVHEDGEAWRPWLQAASALLRQRASALSSVAELLQDLVTQHLMPRAATFPGWLTLARVSGDYRTLEIASLGAMGLAGWTRAGGRWQLLQPDRTLYLAHGCPMLLLWQREHLPGEGLVLMPQGASGDGLERIRTLLAELPGDFPQQSWMQLRDRVATVSPLGGCLMRFTAGVREATTLYPPDFEVYINLLLSRLQARGAGESCYRVKLALDEMFTNAFRHGHRGDSVRPVAVELLLERGCLRVTIQDAGEGYDPLALKDPRDIENLEAPGGRGIFLTHEVMDGIEYGRRTNAVTLTKYLPVEALSAAGNLPPSRHADANS